MNKALMKMGKNAALDGFKRGLSAQSDFLGTQEITVRRSNYATRVGTVGNSFEKVAVRLKSNMDTITKSSSK